MFKGLKWIRLIPDAPGKGGSKTGFHTFQANPVNDTRIVANMHVWRGRWRKDPDTYAVAGTTNDTAANLVPPLSLHAYVYPSLTDPTAQPGVTYLGHHQVTGPTNRYWDFTHANTRDTHGGNAIPATFLDIAGRCFVADGAREGMVLDDRTPAIHAQLNQNLGIGTPAQPLGPSSGLTFNSSVPTKVPNLTGYGFGYVFNPHAGTFYRIHTPNPKSPIGSIIASDVVSISKIDPNYAAIAGTVPASSAVITPGISSDTSPGSGPFATGIDTISCDPTVNPSIVTRSGAWPAGQGRVAGLSINFAGKTFLLGATDKDLAGDQFDVNGNNIGLGANQAYIMGVYDGPVVVNAPFTITGCEVELNATAGFTLQVNSTGTLGYSQSTASQNVPVLVSSVSSLDMWFTENTVSKIGRITTAGVVTEFAIPGGAGGPSGICIGPDHNIWFTDSTTGDIGRVDRATPTSITLFPTPAGGAGTPKNIVTGLDGNLWFTEPGVNQVGRVTPAGIVTEFTAPALVTPTDIVAGPDGNVWFSDPGVGTLGRVQVSGQSPGTISVFASGITGLPTSLTVGPDGNFWFTEPAANKIGRMTTLGAVTEFAVTTGAAGVTDIVSGPDGNLWFTESNINKIGRITTAGVITEFAGPTAAPTNITVTGDGAIWFTEQAASKIGRMTTLGVLTNEFATTTPAAGPLDIVGGGIAKNLGNMILSGTGTPLSPAPWGGPTYAYAWYDPETGHVSNVCPLFTISTPPATPPNPPVQDFVNVTPYFRIDSGAISYPSGVDATRFSHLIFFRTLSAPNTSTLYPIGSLQPFVGKVHPGAGSTRGSWNPLPLQGWMGLPNVYTDAPPVGGSPNYWFDFSSDTDLLLSGGFRAPQETNEKPMVTLRGGIEQPGFVAHQAYWDRRLWVVNTQEPDVVAFSCDEAQCPLGIPEESFPPTNRLRIPAVDGQVMGMRAIGEMLLITTNRWAYTIAGNNESNYRLLRVSTRMAGVGPYQMDEFSSEVEGNPSIVYFFGKDGIVYEWVPGGSVKGISSPIQDFLTAQASNLAVYQSTRVHCASIESRRVVVVSVPILTGPSPFIFDIDNRTWTSNPTDDGTTFRTNVFPAALTTVYGLNPSVQEFFSIERHIAGDITMRRWLADNTASTSPGSIFTFPITFDTTKARKQVCMVNAHLSEGTATCQLVVDESTAGFAAPAVTMVNYPDPLYSVYDPAGYTSVDHAGAKDIVVLTAMFDATNAKAPVGYRFVATVNATGTTQQELYAVDIGFIDYEEQGEVDA